MTGLTWEAPGPGLWSHDKSHNDRPLSGFARGNGGGGPAGDPMARGFAMIGIAIGRPERALINGWPYGKQTFADPSTYDDLEIAAKDFLENRRWIERLQVWEEIGRPERLAECTHLQDIDVTRLGDVELVDHMQTCLEAAARGSRWHFEQHGLCVLIGELVLLCREWGVPVGEVLPLLDGHSAATAHTATMIRAIASALREAGARPSTLDEVRAAGPAAAEALDAYLARHGNQPIAAFDCDVRTLNEMPDLVLGSITAALDEPDVSDEDVAARARSERETQVRKLVPEEHRAAFDEALASARAVYGLRDDDVHYSLWARGLTRRAMLEAAARLAARGALYEIDHVVNVTLEEIRALLVDRTGEPSVEEVAARARVRAEQAALSPPRTIGGPAEPPPFESMPPTVRRMTEAMMAYTQLRRAVADAEPLAGSGIGASPYRARAVVAANADEAFDRVQPGDILVTVLTTPAFNAVLPLCGGLVVEDAGPLSHAAVAARELGIVAVVGVADATRLIPDGSLIELDPVGGRVRTL